jgi:hypothetical protein
MSTPEKFDEYTGGHGNLEDRNKNNMNCGSYQKRIECAAPPSEF